jgi:hypothetical protein
MARGKCATRAQADKLGWSERNTRRYRDYLLDAVLQAALIGTDLEENKRVNWKRPNPAPVQPYPTLKAG